MTTGVRGEYSWIQTDVQLRDFLALYFKAIRHKHIAITAVDSGRFTPSESDRAQGWSENGGIAYSPCLESRAALPADCCCRECCGCDEWYIFRSRPEPLGEICEENVFTTEIARPNVFQFINFGGFDLSDPKMNAITDLFWQQMAWVQPESYLADGMEQLVFITRDAELFAAVDRGVREGRS